MITEYPVLKPIENKDFLVLKEALDCRNSELSELALGNLFLWQDFDRPRITRINGNICLLIHPLNEDSFFLEPLGDNALQDTIATCLNHAGRLSRVSEAFCQKMDQEAFRICTIRNQFDYVYLREELAGFLGNRYDGKRNHTKNFKKTYPDWNYMPLTIDMKDQIFTLFENWCREKRHGLYFQRLDEESQRSALALAIEGFGDLGMLGGAVQVSGRLKGFIIGSPLNRDMITVHFQYGDPEARGVMQVLIQESAKHTFSNFPYLNLEQDLGIPGLRTSKLSYHPFKLIKKYQIEPG